MLDTTAIWAVSSVWSQNSTELAYLSGANAVMSLRPDGTGQRILRSPFGQDVQLLAWR